jgi:hypothetical protein
MKTQQIYINTNEARRTKSSGDNSMKGEGSVITYMSLKIFIQLNRIKELMSYLK